MNECRECETSAGGLRRRRGSRSGRPLVSSATSGSCEPCRDRVARERAAREVVRARRAALRPEVPAELRARCASQAAGARAVTARHDVAARRPAIAAVQRWVPLSLAATLAARRRRRLRAGPHRPRAGARLPEHARPREVRALLSARRAGRRRSTPGASGRRPSAGPSRSRRRRRPPGSSSRACGAARSPTAASRTSCTSGAGEPLSLYVLPKRRSRPGRASPSGSGTIRSCGHSRGAPTCW